LFLQFAKRLRPDPIWRTRYLLLVKEAGGSDLPPKKGSVRNQRLPRDQVKLNTGWIEIFMQPTRSLEPTIFQRKSLADWTLGSVHHPPT
jgi:hypothetical protein